MDHEYLALLFSSSGERIAANLVDSLRLKGITDNCYAYKYRVKSQASLVAKRIRKQKEKPNYCITHITDVIGVRLVTLFKGDMLTTFEKLLANLRDGLTLSGTDRFASRQPEEIIVYRGSSALTDFAEAITEITERIFAGCKVQSKFVPEGYSSIHIVARIEPGIGDRKLEGQKYELPVEIQIRTVFEDAWGEIDHRYGYVIREGKDAGTPLQNPEHILAHLRVLKDFSDACMDYAECIRNEAVPKAKISVAAGKTISVESDDELLKRFVELGLDGEFIEQYKEARYIRDKAEAESLSDWSTARRNYILAAETFRELGNSLHPENLFDVLKLPDRLGLYYCRMNEALCLMSTNIAAQVSAAASIYAHLEVHFPRFPLLKMRSGQAQGKLDRIDAAIQKIRESGAIMREIRNDLQENSIWPDEMPEADYDHMVITQPKLLGFYLWKKIRTLEAGDREQRARLFTEAYDVTLEPLKACKERAIKETSILNNLIYYAVGFLTNAEESDSRVPPMKQALQEHLEQLLPLLGDKTDWSIEDLDTIYKAYALVGNSEAKDIATMLVAKCLSDSNSDDPELRLTLTMGAYYFMTIGKLSHTHI